jgi:hypothetical protein
MVACVWDCWGRLRSFGGRFSLQFASRCQTQPIRLLAIVASYDPCILNLLLLVGFLLLGMLRVSLSFSLFTLLTHLHGYKAELCDPQNYSASAVLGSSLYCFLACRRFWPSLMQWLSP